MKIVKSIFFVFVLSTALYAQETKKDWTLTPFLNYEYLSFDEQHIHSPGEGMVFIRGNMTPPLSEERNSLLIAGIFKQYIIKENPEDYPNLYHSINLMVDRKIKRHLILGLSTAESDKPYYGGWRSFIGGIGYGYELIRRENVSLTLGGGIGFGDFGIKLPNGKDLHVMPLPIVRFNIDTSFMDLSFEYLKNPVLNITLLPDYRIQLINAFSISKFRDLRDLIFDIRLMYRLFGKESKFGDFAGIGVGVKNGGLGFSLAEEGKSYEMYYHSVYGMLDLSFLQVQGGYSFNGLEVYDLERKKDIGDGFFLNIFLAWQF
ncbi:MAG: hypothetical protein FWH35_07260 [Treponema sp.]|nr:hypothetical protein [Treponema sp.]